MGAIYMTVSKDVANNVMKTDVFRKFVSNVLDNPNPEPFCPFAFSGYCNDAYSNRCYQCECAAIDYLRVNEIK